MTAQLSQHGSQSRVSERLTAAWDEQTARIADAPEGNQFDYFADILADIVAAEAITPEEVRQLGEDMARMPGIRSQPISAITAAVIRRLFARHGDIERTALLVGELAAGFLAAQERAFVATDAIVRMAARHLGTLRPCVAWITDLTPRLLSHHHTSELALDIVSLFAADGHISPDGGLKSACADALGGKVAEFNAFNDGKMIHGWVEPLRSAKQEIIGTIGFAIDQSAELETIEDQSHDGYWYRTLVETVNGVFYENDLVTGRYTFVSPRAQVLGGYPVADWLEEHDFFFNKIHPDDWTRVRTELALFSQPDKTYQIEYRMRASDESWLTVQNFFALYRGTDGRILARGVIFDVSERRATEATLQQAEDRFRAVFDHAGVGIAILDSGGDVAMSNDTLTSLLGYSRAELFGRALTEFSFEEDRAIGPNFFGEVVSGEREAFTVEKRYIRKDGRLVWAHVTVTGTREQNADRVLVIAILKDITARKLAEAQLHQQLSLTQAIISSFRGGLCALDRDGRVTFVNPAAEQMLGWREEELLGTMLADRLQPARTLGSGPVPEWESATQRGHFLASDDATFVRRDGTTFSSGYTLAPILQDGSVTGAILGFRDLTEQKRLQGELTAVNRLLAESREQAQQHLARELHDGALQVLIGISYQLGRRLSSKPDEDLQEVRYSVLDVVAQLRALLGELRPAGLEELGFAAALEGYVARLQREAGPQAPEITIDLDDAASKLPLPVARTLFRVAQEGLRNALRHAEASRLGVQLRISDEIASLTVRDDGRGFAVPSSLGALTKSNHFGLVGMAERVALAGGQLAIRSQIERGTTLFLQLPLTPEAQPTNTGQIELTSTLILHTNQARRNT